MRIALILALMFLLTLTTRAQSYCIQTSTNLTTWTAITPTNALSGKMLFRIQGIGPGWTMALGTLTYYIAPAVTNGITGTFSNNVLTLTGSLATSNDSARWASSTKSNVTEAAKIQ